MAKFRFLGYLAEMTGVRVKDVTLEQPKQLRDICHLSLPEGTIIILINGKVGYPDSLIKNEDSVTIMPIISGG
jgi:sulfur carrier protein ThiS